MDKVAHYPGIAVPAPHAPLSRFRHAPRLMVLLAAVLLAGCGGSQAVKRGAAAPASGTWPVIAPADPAAANAVLMRAFSLVGTPYRYGGNTPDSGFDCSGLINYVYADVLQLRLPRTTGELAAYQGPRIRPDALAAGDLVFFGRGGRVTHAGIYVGEGRFVHAPSTGGTVRLDHLDGHYWRDHYSGARRVLN